MNGRQLLVMAAMVIFWVAIFWVAAPGSRVAYADNAASGVNGDDGIGPADVAMPTSISEPAPFEASSIDQSLGTNPLWGIPLAALSATRDRPLFSPSRRQPVAALAVQSINPVAAVSPSAAPKPALDLVGTIESKSEGYAVFINTTTHNVVRLKTGQGEDGWILRSVGEREAVLYKNDRTEVLELPSIRGPLRK